MKSLRDKIAEIVLNDFTINNEKVDAIEALIEREKAASYLEGIKDAESVMQPTETV